MHAINVISNYKYIIFIKQKANLELVCMFEFLETGLN